MAVCDLQKDDSALAYKNGDLKYKCSSLCQLVLFKCAM